MQEQTQEPYSYWKKPWHPWLILGAAAVQLAVLGMSVRQYRRVAGAGVLSGAEWAAFAAQEQTRWAFSGMLAVCLLGMVLIGALVRSQAVRPAGRGHPLLDPGPWLGDHNGFSGALFLECDRIVCVAGAAPHPWQRHLASLVLAEKPNVPPTIRR